MTSTNGQQSTTGTLESNGRAAANDAEAPACVVIGGGPAGLTAAYELSKLGLRSMVLEADSVVGGISRTAQYKGYRFDVGGHRFFTKVDYVQELWEEILGDEFLTRPRLSRIFYRGQLFDYPLKPVNALRGLGLIESARVGLSYLRARLFPTRDEKNFEQWVTNRFGRRLFEIFFKTYTEKVWGMPCSEISAEWAAQRIKNLDLMAAVRAALFPGRKRGGHLITTLIDEFQYPRHGPGQMWEACTRRLRERGSEVVLQARVERLRHENGRVTSATVAENGTSKEVAGDHFLSSMPIRTLLHILDPPPPREVLAAADRLRYRDFLTVALIIDEEELFPDNWVYIHSPDVQVGRIQNYKNWSPDMVPDPARTALGLEYFVQEGDELWTSSDEALIAQATRELESLGLAPAGLVVDGTVLRMPKAYPVYDDAYREALDEIRAWLAGLPNLQLIGRNGQHRYNNQDHSMMTGVYAARNVRGAGLQIWDVNVEQDYHEERSDGAPSNGGDRLVPERIDDAEGELIAAFRRYDPAALAGAMAVVCGVGIFSVTALMLLQGGELGRPTLSLLGNYLVGYSVTWWGAFLGLAEGLVIGGLLGALIARGINAVIGAESRRVLAQIERAHAHRVMEDGESVLEGVER